MAFKPISITERGQIIDFAATNGKLLNFNGGQVYIKMSNSTVLILDFTTDEIRMDLLSNEEYIKDNNVSAHYRDNPVTPSYELMEAALNA